MAVSILFSFEGLRTTSPLALVGDFVEAVLETSSSKSKRPAALAAASAAAASVLISFQFRFNVASVSN